MWLDREELSGEFGDIGTGLRVLIFLGAVRSDRVAEISGTEEIIQEAGSITYLEYEMTAEKKIEKRNR